MKSRCISEPVRELHSERGQAATEYALLVFWTVLIVVLAWKALELALLDSYQDLASLICLPIP
jgi:Flp pilus assembly pilin Flp